MKKKLFIWIAAIVFSIGVLCLILLYFYGFNLSRPDYSDEYFTQDYRYKYRSPETAWDHYFQACMSNDAGYYQEVLGRKITDRERESLKEFPYEGFEKPEIVKMDKKQNMAYIVTDNNWGLFFEKVKGRWVFTPEDWGANVRAFFRVIK